MHLWGGKYRGWGRISGTHSVRIEVYNLQGNKTKHRGIIADTPSGEVESMHLWVRKYR